MNGEQKRPPAPVPMGRGETLAALIYLPVHAVILPLLLSLLLLAVPGLSGAAFNLLYYAAGLLYMLLFERRYLRREFDVLCDNALDCVIYAFRGFGLMLILNLAVNGLLSLLPTENPNNAAVMDMAGMDMGKTAVMAVLLAPIVEELIFRAGIFSLCRRSRVLAYGVSILVFSLYHVWSYALAEPGNWIYLIQYFPASFVLCRCYERSGTVWGSMLLHALINGASLAALSLLEGAV